MWKLRNKTASGIKSKIYIFALKNISIKQDFENDNKNIKLVKKIFCKNLFFKNTEYHKVFTRIYNQKILGHPKNENPFY